MNVAVFLLIKHGSSFPSASAVATSCHVLRILPSIQTATLSHFRQTRFLPGFSVASCSFSIPVWFEHFACYGYSFLNLSYSDQKEGVSSPFFTVYRWHFQHHEASLFPLTLQV